MRFFLQSETEQTFAKCHDVGVQSDGAAFAFRENSFSSGSLEWILFIGILTHFAG